MFRSRLISRRPFLPSSYASVYNPLHLQQRRTLKLSANAAAGLKSYGSVINILAGAYIGGLIVSLGSFYFLYHDANERQSIPFELSFEDQIEAVKAINKDDVLRKPNFAVKHYRKILFDLAKRVDPSIDESQFDNYNVPIIDSQILVYDKSNKFSNFYIDVILRYSKALLAKGELDASIKTLRKIIDDDLIYYKLGDAERLSECSRLLAKVSQSPDDRIHILQRSIDMLSKTYSSIQINDDYTLKQNSKVSDELINCLNDMAFQLAKMSQDVPKKRKSTLLNESLAIYLSTLQALTTIREKLETRKANQSNYPLFNVDRENLITQICSVKAHISEILWAQGFKQDAINWSEEILNELYYDHASSPKVSPILENVLANLADMYSIQKKRTDIERCQRLKKDLKKYEKPDDMDDRLKDWYESVINRWSKIIYDQGPLGIILVPLQERYGPGRKIRELEEFEKEDEL
ncbi:hypothetical protein CANMA_005024 [Candida margitis]|uniref:uncharacterized protein n=1 Tax=Candida margitis TaxID=1775924 RepID=UPI002227FE5E|nr:uncharacterized protein CANMA_005024 [Candida margitis]KAI5952999.1 hypothetical protein CANMA_005024 [Candida margitis]